MPERKTSRGAVRPPFIEAIASSRHTGGDRLSRGAVRPPFIEADAAMRHRALAGWSRGAVRPPFIEAGEVGSKLSPASSRLGGQSAPPSLKPLQQA